MKKIIDGIYIRAIAHATEDEAKVLDALEFISGRRDFERDETVGYHGNKIVIFQMTLRKNKEIRELLNHLFKIGVIDTLLPNIQNLVDDEGNLFFRVDKQEAYLGRIALNGLDSISVRIKILSYPRKKSVAIENIKNLIAQIQSSPR